MSNPSYPNGTSSDSSMNSSTNGGTGTSSGSSMNCAKRHVLRLLDELVQQRHEWLVVDEQLLEQRLVERQQRRRERLVVHQWHQHVEQFAGPARGSQLSIRRRRERVAPARARRPGDRRTVAFFHADEASRLPELKSGCRCRGRSSTPPSKGD